MRKDLFRTYGLHTVYKSLLKCTMVIISFILVNIRIFTNTKYISSTKKTRWKDLLGFDSDEM